MDSYGSAIIRWRQQLDHVGDGLAAFQQSSTVSTMLFGCRRWLDAKSPTAAPEDVTRIQAIQTELEGWLKVRGLAFNG